MQQGGAELEGGGEGVAAGVMPLQRGVCVVRGQEWASVVLGGICRAHRDYRGLVQSGARQHGPVTGTVGNMLL